MSDLGRKNVSEKVTEAVKPDNEKTTLEKTKENVTNKVDDFAAKNTPDNQKSFSQTISDNVKEGHDDAKQTVNQKEGTLADTALEYVDAAKEQAANAAQYISGVVTGGAEGAKNAAEEVSSKK